MRWFPRVSAIVLLNLVAMVSFAVSGPGVALAHAGHAHAQRVSTLDGLLQVAATASALVIVYILATWFYRYRDTGTRREPGSQVEDLQEPDSDVS